MRNILALATVAGGALLLSACNKPAENAAAPANETSAVAEPDAMSTGNAADDNAMDANTTASNAAAGAALKGTRATNDNLTEGHSGSSGK